MRWSKAVRSLRCRSSARPRKFLPVLRHLSCTDVEIRLDITEDAVRVEVTDDGVEGCPVAEVVQPDAEHGRGLMIVSRLASRWGVELSGGGTAVWFELRCPRSPARRERQLLL